MRFIAPSPINLLEALKLVSPDSSKTTLRSWVEQGRVTVDERPITDTRHVVNQGEQVCVGKRLKYLHEDIKILFEDEHLVVIEKPEGLLSVATNFDKSTTAHEILKRRFHSQKVTPVHRLDRETSGIMVFAYSDIAKEGLKELFFVHDIEREYTAVVEGSIEGPTGTWQSFLAEDDTYFVKSVPQEKGKLAITHFRVMKQKNGRTLLKLQLETGRKNQIRVHCKEAGHAIAGDKKYGATFLPGRLCLHASKLGFTHPVTGKKMVFESQIPELFFKIV
jgi:23S rRNA pseudouridine1911/1915/1917 synthase